MSFFPSESKVMHEILNRKIKRKERTYMKKLIPNVLHHLLEKKDILQTFLTDVSWMWYSHAPNQWPELFLRRIPICLPTWCSPGQVPGRIPRSSVITLSSCSNWEIRLGLSTRYPIRGEKTHVVGGLCRWQEVPGNWGQQFWTWASMTSAAVQ